MNANLICKASNGNAKDECPRGYKCCGDHFGGNFGKAHRSKRRTLKRRERNSWKAQAAKDADDDFYDALDEAMAYEEANSYGDYDVVECEDFGPFYDDWDERDYYEFLGDDDYYEHDDTDREVMRLALYGDDDV